MCRAFTLIELLLIVGIIAILAALAVSALHDFQLTSDLDKSAEELINTLRLAQQKTIASEGPSSWGVYFSTVTSPHQYVLFKGENYSSREVLADEIHKMSGAVLISGINLGGGLEVVFNRVSGTSRQQGQVSLALKADPSETKTVYIGEFGQTGFTNPFSPSDFNRIKDSRHLQVDYNRNITTTTENLILTFSYDSSTQTETIAIASNFSNGQINWEGQMNVAGSMQKIKIHTSKLNDHFSGTQFSIHRDRRYNNRALKIKLSGDSSGTLVEYSADGLTTAYTSVNVTNLQWQ